jgi:hypothetical protein
MYLRDLEIISKIYTIITDILPLPKSGMLFGGTNLTRRNHEL